MTAWSRQDKIAAFAAAVATLAALLTGVPYLLEWADRQSELSVEILEPVEGASLEGEFITVSGKVKNPKDDMDLWLIARPIATGTWYPMKRLNVQPDNSWTVSGNDVNLGGLGQFEVSVYSADNSASGELAYYAQQVKDGKGRLALRVCHLAPPAR